MSEHEYNTRAFNSSNSKIFLKLSLNGNIFVDWSDLPRYENIREYVIHYKSLNNNRSRTIRVPSKKQRGFLKKIQLGHLYEIHVCAVDRSDGIIASSERAQIQTKTSNEAPRLRVTKSTPDFIWLEWEKADETQVSDIVSYKLIINGETKVLFPSNETKYVVSDGTLGQQYVFQIEMIQKDGKVTASIPVSVTWPGVTIPESHAVANGNDELIICWGDSTSINDGNIESYTLHLYDSNGQLLNKIGPNCADCRQVWVKDMHKGVYIYILEIKLLNSKQSICSIPTRIECGKESTLPVLTYDYTDSDNEKQLIHMAYHLIRIRDNMKSKRFLDKCKSQLQHILSTLTDLTDSMRLTLTIESKSNNNILKTYQLLIDDEESNLSIPGTVKDFSLELSRREKPYELAVLVTPELYGTKSKKVLVEASGHFSFFCTHFDRQRSTESCSYLETLYHEKPLAHQGLIKPQTMNQIEIYDLTENRKISLPSSAKARRFSILFFYLKQCVPSMAHLNYFAMYASTHRAQYNYISIHCDEHDLDDLQELTKDFNDIQCCTEFSSDEFEYEYKENEKPIHEILALDGVPMYFILDLSSRIIWRGRLCAQNQSEYDAAMDHLIAEVRKIPCPPDNCQSCQYRSMNETRINSELNEIDRNLQMLLQRRFLQSQKKQQEGDKQDRKRRIISMKKSITNN